ncbi:MAG: chemotaxis protein CheA [Methylophilaceae bacterium]
MSIDMSQFYEVFFDESEELLAEAEHLLLGLDVEDPDAEDLNAIFRAAHSIKGGAATFGFTDMTEITHVLENLLDRIRKDEMALTAEHVDAFLSAKDVLKMEVDGHRLDEEVDLDQVAEVKATLKALAEAGGVEIKAAPVAQVDTPAATPAVETTPAPKPAEATPVEAEVKVFNVALPEVTDKDLANLKEELALLGEVEANKQEDGHSVLKLSTDSSESDIVSICSFIVDADALVITTEKPASLEVEIKAEVTEDPGYGFFNEAAELPTKKEIVATEIDQTNQDGKVKVVGEVGYGLFAEEGEEAVEEGYGFFAPFKPHEDAAQAQLIGDDTKLTPENSGKTETTEQAKSGTEKSTEAKPEKRKAARRKTDKAPASAETTSIRVGIEKVDMLINLVGELVITQAMIDQRVSHLEPAQHEGLINSVTQLTRNTRDLQEAVMSIRMMPMDFVFSRFPRMVRDLAGKLSKKIELVTEGATTELDKGLIEKIVDPLTHLVRNSIDHGVEIPEKRKAAGKPETGILTLSAMHKGGSIVIEVTDDGAGLDRDKILAKAQSNGLSVNENMTDTEIFGLIFAPGFSTAEVVTDVSGRGVGMDVVKRNITSMGGTVEIRSALGFGTTISIALPLTLAILDGMSVALGKSLYVIPLNLIVETLQPVAEDIKTVAGEGYMVHVRGEYLPIISLHRLFNQPTDIMDPTDGVLVLIEAEGKKSALFVDRLVGQQQVVIKSLETNFKKIPGVSGATIMGDGSVALIIDVPTIIQMGQTTNYVTGGSTFAQSNNQSISDPVNA